MPSYRRGAKRFYRIYKFTRGPVGDIKVSLAGNVTFDKREQAESLAHTMRLRQKSDNIVVASDPKEVELLASEKAVVQKNIFGGRSKLISEKTGEARYLSDEEIQALKKIYDFSKQRGFKLGLNDKYVGADVKGLERQGYIYARTKYGNTYWIPTERGKGFVAGKRLAEGKPDIL